MTRLSDERLAEIHRFRVPADAFHRPRPAVDAIADLFAEVERLRKIEAAATEWAAAFDEQATTLLAWQEERLSGITSATPKYDAMNAAYQASRDAAYVFRAALGGADDGGTTPDSDGSDGP